VGELFNRYFQLLAGQLPAAEYGVIATPTDLGTDVIASSTAMPECLCPAC